uniref:Uncharacterized protein n=1 Tax=Cajanus cajan TaxID=3821 RepID=A0A151TI49_CAJCA|nr:hypothetical protein KK1_012959 [Cajanus cajan]
MEWTTLQHLDLRHVGRGSRPLQPHAATFHPHQALVAVAIGTYIVEFDALTGNKISALDIGAPVVRMSYSPTREHTVIAILQDCTIRSCDFDLEQTCVLNSPEKKNEHISSDAEVHLALTPLQSVVFFGFHKRMSVTVVGTVEGGRPPTKIKTDLKKPIVNIACHPRLPVLYVAYAEGLIRAYNIYTYAVHYTLQLDNTIKLNGAGAFAFHPTLEWIFIGDRRGTLLAWDVSTERPSMIGLTQVGSQPITSVAWLPTLHLLATLSRDGNLQVWKTRIKVNLNAPPMPASFFGPAAIESIDIPRILSQQGGEAVYPLPRIKALEFHPKSNLVALVFAVTCNLSLFLSFLPVNIGYMIQKIRAHIVEKRESNFFQFCKMHEDHQRCYAASVLKEKLSALGSSGVLADHQLQAQLQEHHLKGHSHLTILDIARKAFLYSHFIEGNTKSAPISRLPLITVLDTKHHLKGIPPFHLELNFFNKENRVLHYPVRAFYVDGPNLMGYNISSESESIYKKLYNSIPRSVEYQAKHLIYSKKQHLFLVVYEFSGTPNEVVIYRENTDAESANSKSSTVKGRDAAFIGPNENQFAILDDDKTGLAVYTLPGGASQETKENDKLFEENQPTETSVDSICGPTPFMFETEVDRIYSTPLDSTLMFASHGNQIGLVKLIQGYRLSTSSSKGHYISTKGEGKKSIKLRRNEIVLQVYWQETKRGFVAGILTTQRVLIVSAAFDILAGTSSNFDNGLPSISLTIKFTSVGHILIFSTLTDDYFRSLLWVGPALLFSTATAISILGWDGKVRTILSTSMPYAVLVGALNDRLLLAKPSEIIPKQKKGVEVKSCLVGLLEPLLIGFATMQQSFEQKLDLSEILYQITSRFDSLRITPRSLDILARGSPVCGDLAVSLSQSGPQFTQVMRGVYAVKSLRFSTALSVLKDEFLRSRDYPQCPPTSHLFHRFRQLGYACIRFGQFDRAKETFEVTADYESMLDLFICHLNPSAMRRLAQKLEEEALDSELRRHCERILRIRSTGWTQGIFANFAAESMVPKGLEWGGGNWEIKTPTNTKDIPQWELAAEVMPYMKTDDGSIPSIIVDHIGVYLGSIKGRGNIVEVREDSLVKAFIPPGNDIKANGLELSSAKPLSNQRVDNSQVAQRGEATANQVSAPEADASLQGDVPPQAVQQSTVHIESVGLPDGGVPPQSPSQTAGVPPSQLQAVPQGAAAHVCFKTGLAHLELNHLKDALSCFDEAFFALAKELSRGSDIKAQATICAQYKITVTLLQEIGRLQRVHGSSAISAKDEMARLSRHLGSLPLLAKHRINCIRTAIKRNMEVQNYAYSKQMLELLLSKAPPGKQEEFKSLVDLCVQRGLTNKSIDPLEDPSHFCAATLSRLSTIGYDVCDLCGAKFSAVTAPGCIICGMGNIKRSDAGSGSGPVPSPFG